MRFLLPLLFLVTIPAYAEDMATIVESICLNPGAHNSYGNEKQVRAAVADRLDCLYKIVEARSYPTEIVAENQTYLQFLNTYREIYESIPISAQLIRENIACQSDSFADYLVCVQQVNVDSTDLALLVRALREFVRPTFLPAQLDVNKISTDEFRKAHVDIVTKIPLTR